MPEFSTTTQALLDAVCSNTEPDCDAQHLIAAALEALADQVVPKQQEPPESPHMGNFISHARWIQRQVLRHRILAIAAELRGQNQPSRNSN